MKEGLLQLWNLSAINQYQERIKNINLLIRKGEFCLLWGNDYTGRIFSNIFKGEGQITKGSIQVKNKKVEDVNRDIFEHNKIFYIDNGNGFMDSLDLAENLFLLKKNSLKKVFINDKAIHIQANSLLDSYGLNKFNAESRTDSLSLADKILLTIVKLVGQGAEMIVLNNISPECSEKDFFVLEKLLKKIKEKEVALLVYDSHPELFKKLADYIVLTNQGEIVKKILDKEEFFDYINRVEQKKGNKDLLSTYKKITSLDSITKKVEFEKIRLKGKKPFSITVEDGEIIYLTNLNAIEQTELWNSMIGKILYKPIVKIDGRIITYKDVHKLVEHRIAFWGEYKECVEIFENLSIKDNILLPSLKRISRCGGYQASANYIFKDDLIVEEGFASLVNSETKNRKISDNDVLKTILYKWKLFHPRVLVLNNIISRTDADMKAWLKGQLIEMAGRGTSIILLETAGRDAEELAHYTLAIR